jgi:hypothetical protein
VFNTEYSQIIGPIEADLRKKRHLLIDPKSAKNIRDGKVSYKVWNETNSVSKFDERIGDYQKREKGAVEKNYGAVSTPMLQGFEWEESNEIMEGIDPKKYTFTEVPDMRSKDQNLRPILVGHDATNLH